MKKFLSSIISTVLLTASLPVVTANAEDKLTKEEFLDLVVSETEDFSDGGFIYGKDLKFDAIPDGNTYTLIVYGIKQEDYIRNVGVTEGVMEINTTEYRGAGAPEFYSGCTLSVLPIEQETDIKDSFTSLNGFTVVFYIENVLPGFSAPAESIVEASLYRDYEISSYIYPEITAGDTNGDGSINASDASNVLIAYAYLSTGKNLTLNMTQFDYNNDGIINSADSSAILAKYAELSTSK